MTEYLRTPDENFELADFTFAPHYHRWQDLRMHYVDEGPKDGPVMLLLHGMPTWSYLYRDMIPILVGCACGYPTEDPARYSFEIALLFERRIEVVSLLDLTRLRSGRIG